LQKNPRNGARKQSRSNRREAFRAGSKSGAILGISLNRIPHWPPDHSVRFRTRGTRRLGKDGTDAATQQHRRLCRPPKQMAPAAAAVTVAEIFDRHRQVSECRSESAFVALDSRPGAQHAARPGQIIDMPTYWLDTTHVSTDASPKAPRPFRRTAIKIATCFERYWKPVAQEQLDRSRKFDRKHICAGAFRNPGKHPVGTAGGSDQAASLAAVRFQFQGRS